MTHVPRPMIATPASPPTTPPAMAPVLEPELGSGDGDGAGELEVLVMLDEVEEPDDTEVVIVGDVVTKEVAEWEI